MASLSSAYVFKYSPLRSTTTTLSSAVKLTEKPHIRTKITTTNANPKQSLRLTAPCFLALASESKSFNISSLFIKTSIK